IDSNSNQIKMNKLMKHLLIILTGLNAIFFTGCILTEIDEHEDAYYDIYRNSSDNDLTIHLIDDSLQIVHTLFLESDAEGALIANEIGFNGGDNAIAEYIDILINANFQIMEIRSEGELIKSWISSDVSMNSPYNPNSWEEETPKVLENGLERGRIIFTITNEDLAN
ncbi:MAG: hypothetical protein AB3N10_07280, partial [Allomuricauda sp.]